MIDWGQIVTQLLVILLPILATALITWVSALAAKAIQKLKTAYPKWAEILDFYTPVAVAAAEQLRKTGQIPTGEEAKKYAVTAIQAYLVAHGIKGVEVATIVTAVEAEVGKLPPFGSVPPTTTTTEGSAPTTTTTTTEPAAPVEPAVG